MTGRFTRWLPALLLMAIIFFVSSLSSVPGPPEPWLDRLFKKGAHMVGYGLLALSYVHALRLSGVRHPRRWAFLLGLLYALSDEWHQTFVPLRDGNLLDVVIDSVGMLIALHWWGVRHQPES